MSSENGNGFHPDSAERVVVAGEPDAATVLEPYPADRYQAVREGRMSSDDFISDLIRHVRERLERIAPSI